jgi:hypothetical protein
LKKFRQTLVLSVLLFLEISQVGCTDNAVNSPKGKNGLALSQDDQILRHRFRDIGGAERQLDALVPIESLTLYDEFGRKIEGKAFTSPQNRSNSFFYAGEFAVPKTIRAVWHKEEMAPSLTGEYIGGTIIGDYTVPVASRIPIELLDNLRKHRGTLRLKIRIAPDDVLIGWDIERRPRDPSLGPNVGVPPVFSMVGGDFQEAEIFNGQVVRKGWYIDKKTGRKIETDF